MHSKASREWPYKKVLDKCRRLAGTAWGSEILFNTAFISINSNIQRGSDFETRQQYVIVSMNIEACDFLSFTTEDTPVDVVASVDRMGIDLHIA